MSPDLRSPIAHKEAPSGAQMPMGIASGKAHLLAISLLFMNAAYSQTEARFGAQNIVTAMPEEGAPAGVESISREQAVAERMRSLVSALPAAYEDRYLDDFLPLAVEDTAPHSEAQAEPGMRSLVVESRLEQTRRSTQGTRQIRDTVSGLRFEYRFESLNHGVWSVWAETSHRDSSNHAAPSAGPWGLPVESATSHRLTVATQSFPITAHIMADAAVGDVQSDVTAGLTRSQRLNLGSSSLRGLRLQLRAHDFDLRLGAGRRSRTVSSLFASREADQGFLQWLGYTRRMGDTGFAAVQVQQVQDLPDRYGVNTTASDTLDVRSLAAAVGQRITSGHDNETEWRLAVLHSQTKKRAGNPTKGSLPGVTQTGRYSAYASAAYLDASVRRSSHRLDVGLFSADPGLMLGDQWVGGGTQGLHTRYSRQLPRLHWGLGLNHEWPTAGSSSSSSALVRYSYSSLNGHWHQRLNRRSAWGGSAHLARWSQRGNNSRQSSEQGSLYLDGLWAATLGNTRLQWTHKRNQYLVSNAPAATGDEWLWEQDWLGASRDTGQDITQLRSSLGWATEQQVGQRLRYPTAGLSWRTTPSAQWSLGAALRYAASRSNLYTSRGLSGSVQADWRLSPHWTLGASLLLNQAVVDTTTALPPGASGLARSNDRGLWLTMRYEQQQGTPWAYALQSAQGAGAGRVEGVVYLDANRDGQQQADEPGAAGVDVYLGERLRSTTDNRGNFTFPIAATGVHSLTLRPESVPLPWGEGPASRQTVQVPLRGQAWVALGVQKVEP